MQLTSTHNRLLKKRLKPCWLKVVNLFHGLTTWTNSRAPVTWPSQSRDLNYWAYLKPLIMLFNCATIPNFGQKKKPQSKPMPWRSKW